MLLGDGSQDPPAAVPQPSPSHQPVPPSKERPRVGACCVLVPLNPVVLSPTMTAEPLKAKGASRVLALVQEQITMLHGEDELKGVHPFPGGGCRH